MANGRQLDIMSRRLGIKVRRSTPFNRKLVEDAQEYVRQKYEECDSKLREVESYLNSAGV